MDIILNEVRLSIEDLIDRDLENDLDLATLFVVNRLISKGKEVIEKFELKSLIDEYLDIENHKRKAHKRKAHYRGDSFVRACNVSKSNVNKKDIFINKIGK